MKSLTTTLMALTIALLAITGCETTGSRPVARNVGNTSSTQSPRVAQAQGEPAQTTQATTQQTTTAPVYTPPAGGSVAYFPTGDRSTSVLSVERTAPKEVSLGETFSYTIKVCNIASIPAGDVTVTDYCANTFTVVKSDPEAASGENNKLVWKIGDLAPGQCKTITVTGKATALGEFKNCLSATFSQAVCSTVNVTQPKLTLTAEAPKEVLKCEVIPVKYTVCNPGTGVAKDVTINATLPKGVTTDSGTNTIAIKVGDLAPGACKTAETVLRASASGKVDTKASATGSENLTADASTSTVVKQPKLEIAKTGPKMVFLGRDVTYNIKVTNTGDGEAREAVLEDALPTNASFVSATGKPITGNGKVVWNLGTLKPGDSVEGSVTVKPTGISTVSNSASAKAFCADAVSATAATEVKGIPAILLEVVDLVDPVEVGTETTYVITVTNQGSATDTNIKVVCTLEDAAGYVSGSGATAVSNQGKTVTMAPLASLAAGAKAEWKVVVKAVNQGDIRFAVQMTSDNITRPVNETEATNFYK